MTRRGAMLFELLVAIAIFALAATLLLSTLSDVIVANGRDATTARAVDLARTRLSELEAGLIAPEDLRAESGRRADDAGRGAREELVVDAVISRSDYPGLSLVELRVFDGVQDAPRFVLRQLVSLPRDRWDERGIDAPTETALDGADGVSGRAGGDRP